MSPARMRSVSDASGGAGVVVLLRRSFAAQMVVAAAGAMTARLVVLEVTYRSSPLLQDAPEYLVIGQRVSRGLGWTSPFSVTTNGIERQTANHPPLASAWLSLARPFGLDTNDGARVWMALLGVAAVVLVGYLGREVAGAGIGSLAAGIAALSPMFWMNDMAVMAETGAQATTALVLLLALRYRRAPSALGAGAMAAAVGVAALARSELILFLPLLVVPLVLLSAGAGFRRRLGHLAAAGLWLVAALLPWVGWNLVRFERPVVFTTGMDLTIAQTNCPLAYYGRGTGRWSALCGYYVELDKAGDLDDESVLAAQYRQAGLGYVADHRSRVPAVVAARVGRTFGWYHPVDQLVIEEGEGQKPGPLRLGLAAYAVTLALAAVGTVAAWRRRLLLWPLAVPVLVVLVAVAISRGGIRFRAPVEVPLAVLAAMGVAALPSRLSRLRR